jgi:hypothetical protein
MMLLCASVSYGEEPQDVVVLAGPRMVRHRLGEAENDLYGGFAYTRENYRLVPETDSRAGSPGDPGVGRL